MKYTVLYIHRKYYKSKSFFLKEEEEDRCNLYRLLDEASVYITEGTVNNLGPFLESGPLTKDQFLTIRQSGTERLKEIVPELFI